MKGIVEVAYEFIMRNQRISSEETYPYTGVVNRLKKKVLHVATVEGFKCVPPFNEGELLKVLERQPVTVFIDGREVENYDGGIFRGPRRFRALFCRRRDNLNHFLTLVGYGSTGGEKYWLAKNSWGTEWGEGGYIRIKRDVSAREGVCGLTFRAIYPIVNQKNSFRRRNGLLSDTISTSQCSSSYGQNSMGETISSICMKSRSEQAEHSLSSDSRTRSNYIECVFEGSSSLQQDEDHTTTCKIQDDGETDSIVPGEKLGGDDDTPQGSSQDCDPSSVTWEEKTEIYEPSSHQFDHIVRDEDETLELMRENCDFATESSGVTTPKNIDPENIICASLDGLESLSEVDEFDEAGSEPDKYADALNTLESDAETPIIIEGIDTGETPMIAQKSEMIAQKSEMSSAEFTGETPMFAQKSEISSVEFGTVPYCASSKQISLNYPNLDSSENMVSTQPLDVTAAPADPDISADIHLSEATGVLNILPADDCRSSCSESSSSLSSVPNSHPPPPVCDKILSTFVESQGSHQEVSKVSSVNVWTNGGLLGLEPSKPPDHNMSNGKQHDSMFPAEDNANDHSYNIVLPKSHPNGLREVGSLVKTPEQTDKSSKSQAGRDGPLDMVNSNNLHMNQPSRVAKTKTQTIGDSNCSASYHDKQGNEALPPVQWRVVKPHFDVAKNEQDFIFEVDICSNDLQVLETTTQPSNPDPPNHPHINDITNCILRSKQDQHSPDGNCIKLDEREDLLNQIQSKSVSLRPTVPTKSTLSESPTTTNKVAAILEKADAIRQAFVGNEDGTEENWSDG